MRQNAKLTLLLSALAGLAMVPGCAAGEPAATPPPTTTICPDSLIQIDDAILSAAVDAEGKPTQLTSEFRVDSPKIYCTFMVPDICCTTIHVKWFRGDEVVGNWLGVGIGNLIPQTLTLDPPPGGFVPGNYHVTMYLGIRELATRQFTVK